MLANYPQTEQISTDMIRQLTQAVQGTRGRKENGEIGLYEFSYGFDFVNRTALINHLIHRYGLHSYLEIGVRDGANYHRIQAETKVGVDPVPLIPGIREETSDEFFERLEPDVIFDLVFIDGLHLESQVKCDISNSLDRLSSNGLIVLHDCNPPTEFHQRDEYEVNGEYPSWNGTTWKAYAEFRCERADLEMHVVDTDWGVGVVRHGKQEIVKSRPEEIKLYSSLAARRKDILNLISVQEFLRRF